MSNVVLSTKGVDRGRRSKAARLAEDLFKGILTELSLIAGDLIQRRCAKGREQDDDEFA